MARAPTVPYYGNAVPVVDQGDAVAAWVSRAVGAELRIAALEATFRRSVPLDEFAVVDGIDQSRFVDVAPILMTNQASLADLNGRLDTPVPMNRFRPNIVIDGLDAFAEDSVSHMRRDTLRLVRATHCERCAVTCTDQETGQRSPDPCGRSGPIATATTATPGVCCSVPTWALKAPPRSASATPLPSRLMPRRGRACPVPPGVGARPARATARPVGRVSVRPTTMHKPAECPHGIRLQRLCPLGHCP